MNKEEKELRDKIYESGFALTNREENVAEYFYRKGKQNKIERFEKCIERKLMDDGSIEIHCARGLWAVFAMDHDKAEVEARHYWSQYDSDGEYTHII